MRQQLNPPKKCKEEDDEGSQGVTVQYAESIIQAEILISIMRIQSRTINRTNYGTNLPRIIANVLPGRANHPGELITFAKTYEHYNYFAI
jgi:hypothetical protein